MGRTRHVPIELLSNLSRYGMVYIRAVMMINREFMPPWKKTNPPG